MQETTWTFYTKTTEAWDAMLADCKKATKTLDLEQFIFINDEIGKRFLDVCIQKAKEGVRVRLLCDAAGSFPFFRSSLLNDLRIENFEIVFFNTFIPGTLHNHSLWLFRDHRKLLVVDGSVGYTGSICLTSEVKNWRDTHVRIVGEVVSEMQRSFNAMWHRAHKRKFRPQNVEKVGLDGFNYVRNDPLPRRRFLYYRLIDAIRNAKKTIFLTTPYFVPDRRFLRVIKLARQRGVEVRLLIPLQSDHSFVDIGAQSFFHTLLQSGVKIYRYQGTMIHSKVAIIDDDWATIGSLNFDNISFLYNFEANLVSLNKRFISELRVHFWADLTHSKELTLAEWNKRSFIQKIKEVLIVPIRKIL